MRIARVTLLCILVLTASGGTGARADDKADLVVIALLAPSRAPTEDAEAVHKESIKLLGDLADILKSVKDKAGAEAALPKLKAIDERLTAQRTKLGDLDLSDRELTQVLTKLDDTRAATMKALLPEIERVEKLPGVHALLVKELAYFKQLDEAKLAAVKARLKLIDFVIREYQRNMNEVPKSPKVLTEGDKPALAADVLLDPWKQPLQYDARGPKNKGKKPDIWTVTPDKRIIGNWEIEKK
jgi:hypothetical protein